MRHAVVLDCAGKRSTAVPTGGGAGAGFTLIDVTSAFASCTSSADVFGPNSAALWN